jgi:hypothetical protein
MPDIDPRQEDPRVRDLVTGAMNVKLDRIEGQTFEDVTIFADGRSFTRCTFERCRIVVSLGRSGRGCCPDHGDDSAGRYAAAPLSGCNLPVLLNARD